MKVGRVTRFLCELAGLALCAFILAYLAVGLAWEFIKKFHL